jgi:hypothetical protein
MGKLLIRTGPFLACTPSLAAAIGTTACIAVHGPSIATITRGTWTRALACGACVTNQYITGTETLFVTGKDLSIFLISQTVFPFRDTPGQNNKGTAF